MDGSSIVHELLNDIIVTRHQCIEEIAKYFYKIDSYVWWSNNEWEQVSVGIV